jgi:hypothetical protein
MPFQHWCVTIAPHSFDVAIGGDARSIANCRQGVQVILYCNTSLCLVKIQLSERDVQCIVSTRTRTRMHTHTHTHTRQPQASEVHNPAKTFPRALLLAMVIVVVMYLSVLSVAIGNTPCCSSDWSTCAARYWGTLLCFHFQTNHQRGKRDVHGGRVRVRVFVSRL